jgi:hypothetical protein
MKIILAIGAILAVVSGAFFLSQEQVGPQESSFFSEKLEETPAREPASQVESKFGLAPKHIYEYGFEKKIQIEGLQNEFPVINLSGKLYVHVVDQRSGITQALVWQEIKGFSGNKEKFLVKISSAQKKYEIFANLRDQQSNEEETNVLKDLLAHLFYFSNEDTVGKYRFQLAQATEKTDGLLILYKTKKEYEKPGKTTPKITKFIQKIYLGGGDYPTKVLAKEFASIGEGEFAFRSQALTKILFVQRSQVAQDMSVAEFTHRLPLQLVAQQLAIEQHPEYQKIHWPTVLAKLANINELTSSEQLQLFGDLVKALKLDPSRVSELKKLILEKKVLQAGAASPLFQGVVGALATDGGAEAQVVLQEIYDHPAVPQSGKGSILSALTTTQAPPTDETLTFLQEKAEAEQDIDLAQGALFALGSAIEKTKFPEGEIQFLLRKWQEAIGSGNLDQQLAVMDAMGNSGRAEFFETVSSQAKNARVIALQARATFALRGMHIEGARSILIAALSAQDSTIRYAAASAMYQAPWNIAFSSPLTDCAQNETDATIRNSCREALAKNQIRVAAK